MRVPNAARCAPMNKLTRFFINSSDQKTIYQPIFRPGVPNWNGSAKAGLTSCHRKEVPSV